ncbi:MAG: hypothetical protein ACYDBV_04655 [Nitrospiria bacterium]
MEFNQYIGIDWSGAKGPQLPGLQVAVCKDGTSAPELITNPKEGHWTRTILAEWLKVRIQNHGPILVGFDFAFAFPYCDKTEYFPKHDESPINLTDLWQTIENNCNSEKDFYGGQFFKFEKGRYANYFLYQTYKGDYFEPRKRITESFCRIPTSSVFKFVGPGQVGTGSIAGIRFLYEMTKHLGDNLSIWPFDQVLKQNSVCLEIFPSLFYKLADQNGKDWSQISVINHTLEYFGSDPITKLKIKRKDEADALISSAAIRHLSKDPHLWSPTKMTFEAKVYEGWIFGVS